MKINDILVLETEQLDEYGNAPNDSTDPRVAGGVPYAVGNMKAQRKARAGLNKQLQDPVAPQQPVPTGSTQNAGASQTAQPPAAQNTQPTVDTTGQTAGNVAQTAGQTVTVKKGTPGNSFMQGVMNNNGVGRQDVADLWKGTPDKVTTTGNVAQTGGNVAQTAGPTVNTSTTQPADAKQPAQGQQQGGQQGQPQAGGAAQPATATDANKDPQFKIFKDATAFKSEWEKYAAAQTEKNKANGMGPYQLISDTEMLTALKDMWMRSGGTKVESKEFKKSQRLIEQRIMKDPIYEGFNRVGRMIAEADLSQEQIKQLFQAVADGAAAGGNVQNAGDAPVNNRTWVGKGGDKAAELAKWWDNVKTKISQSAPVAGFDQSVDAIQGKLLKAAGGDSGVVGQALAKYREFGKQHPIFQGAIYAGLIALAGISGAGLGGAALLGGIKIFDRLLQGDKASSALWRGFKTAAIAGAAGQVGQLLHPGQPPGIDNPVVGPDGNPVVPPGGDGTIPPGGNGTGDGIGPGEEIVPPSQNIDPTNPDAWADGTQANGTDTIPYTVQQGETLSQIAKSNGVSVKDMMDANPDITNPDVLKTGQSLQIPQSTGEYNVYDQGVGTQADTLAKIKSGEYTDSPISRRDLSGGAGTGQVNPQSPATLRTPPYVVDNGNGPEVVPRPGADSAATLRTPPYVVDNGNGPEVVPRPGARLVRQSYINPRTMISEYVDYNATMRSRMLAEMRGMPQNGCYLTASGVKAIFEGVVAEGPWDAIKSGVSKVAGGVEKFGQGVADTVKKGYNAAANKITYDKLDLNWRKNYKEFDPTAGTGPVDSEQVKAFLRKQGVTDVLINKVFGDLGLEATQAEPAQDQAQPAQATGFSTGSAFTDLFKKFSDGGGNLAPQVRGVLKDILLTAMRTVESMQRKRMYGAPVLAEVKIDFSAALLKTLR
jgi:LysM repeat protein